MPGREINILTLKDLAERVATRLERAERGLPAYTLILGSGFSYPLLPTARGMVQGDVAWWLLRQKRRDSGAFTFRPIEEPELDAFERDLWSNLHRQSSGSFKLQDGLPSLETGENVSLAYRVLMGSGCADGLSTPDLRRDYFRDAVRRIGNSINPAHLLLADLLAAQDRPTWPEHRTSFCRTIFTTNIDPLLQRSLQLCQKLYFMTDQPDELGFPEDKADQAIHLVYAHGSVHRYRLVNSGAEIEKIRERGAESLAPYFRSHGVIVIGYSGWTDVVMAALEKCSMFDGNLYWCDIHQPSEITTKLSPSALALLRQKSDSAFYVRIPNAQSAMLTIRTALKLPAAPELIVEPVRVMIQVLKSVELGNEERLDARQELAGGNLISDLTSSLERLSQVLRFFDDPQKAAREVAASLVSNRQHQRVLALFDAGDLAGAVQMLSEELEDPEVSQEVRDRALYNRGVAHLGLRDLESAERDLTIVANNETAIGSTRARAFIKLGILYGLRGKSDAEFISINSALEIDGIEPSMEVVAYYRRGLVNGIRRNPEMALRDFNSALALADIPEARAEILVERGIVYANLSQNSRAMEDFNATLEVQVINPWLRARALYQVARCQRNLGESALAKEVLRSIVGEESFPGFAKGRAYAQLGYIAFEQNQISAAMDYFARALGCEDFLGPERSHILLICGEAGINAGDLDGSIENLTSAINSQNLEASDHARAHLVRAQAFMSQDRFVEALMDLDKVIDLSDLDAILRLEALDGRGMTRYDMNLHEEALEDFEAILASGEASPRQAVRACFMRGVVKGEIGLFKEAIDDFSLCIASDVLSEEMKAEALTNRAAVYSELNRMSEARDDLQEIANLESATPKQKADALGTLGWQLLVAGDLARSRSSTEAAISIVPADAGLRFNLGLANLLLGDPEKARVAYDEGSALASSDELREALEDLDQAAADHGHLVGADDIVRIMRQRVAESSPTPTAADQPLDEIGESPRVLAESDVGGSENSAL